jgi:ribulose-5-phosphate 4-epimerase/fuculose-1-phosphate aldolase
MNNVQEVIFYGRELFLAGINIGSNGNISFRHGKKVFITKSGSLLSQLKKNELIDINSPKASSEAPAHRIIYENLPEINAVFHVHSMSAIALSLKQKKNYLTPIDLEGKYYFSKIPIVETKLVPGAPDLPKKLLTNHKYGAVIVRGHGLFVFGRSLKEGYARVCTVDNICRSLLA